MYCVVCISSCLTAYLHSFLWTGSGSLSYWLSCNIQDRYGFNIIHSSTSSAVFLSFSGTLSQISTSTFLISSARVFLKSQSFSGLEEGRISQVMKQGRESSNDEKKQASYWGNSLFFSKVCLLTLTNSDTNLQSLSKSVKEKVGKNEKVLRELR